VNVRHRRACRDTEERNRLRADAGFPQLSVEVELRRLSEAERRKSFDDFCANSLPRRRVEEKIIQGL